MQALVNQWNLEDFSICSTDHINDTKGRAVTGFCRPYAQKTAGKPVKMSFNKKKGEFLFVFEADAAIEVPTEIYVPLIHYPHGSTVTVTGGQYKRIGDVIFVYTNTSGRCTVKICK